LAVDHNLFEQTGRMAVRVVVEREAVRQDANLFTVLAVVVESLAHCASREWREVLERSSLQSSSGNKMYETGSYHQSEGYRDS